jgi:hypothetical protein
MDKVVLDTATLAKLAGQDAPIEVWSNYGQLIGVFHPTNEPPPVMGTADAELDAAFARSSQEGRISAAEGRAELLRQRPL